MNDILERIVMLVIDGSYGEGGGQILRTSLTLAAIQARPIRIVNIRAKRKKPGLAAQHLTAVRAAATICKATVRGDHLGSTELVFIPETTPAPGAYEFDVSQAREGGSAGAATLVLQTVLTSLALAPADSHVSVKGGTHVPWSPPFHYLNHVYLPMLARLGLQATAQLPAWGWHPAGEGEVSVEIQGRASIPVETGAKAWVERGSLRRISGVAVASSLPAHIAQRMRDCAANLLSAEGLSPHSIEPQRVRSTSPGAGIFLVAEYETGLAGFSALGHKGKASERVAEEAVEALLAFHRSGAAFDEHLADQLIVPIAASGHTAAYSTEKISLHTLTNLWVVEQFLGPVTEVNQQEKIVRLVNHVTDSKDTSHSNY
jgi:RNA 3'-terminal phosphate cyclase (ATP)